LIWEFCQDEGTNTPLQKKKGIAKLAHKRFDKGQPPRGGEGACTERDRHLDNRDDRSRREIVVAQSKFNKAMMNTRGTRKVGYGREERRRGKKKNVGGSPRRAEKL